MMILKFLYSTNTTIRVETQLMAYIGELHISYLQRYFRKIANI